MMIIRPSVGTFGLLFFATFEKLHAFSPLAIPVARNLLTERSTSTTFYVSQEGGEDVEGVSAEELSSEEVEDDLEETSEDPEVAALKEEIALLEAQLKTKKSSLSYALDQIDEYSKAGYARAVAEMENMRRVRSNMNSSSKSSATATILADFLPVYQKMDELKNKYSSDDFGSKYGGLSIATSFEKMGVREFSVLEGEIVEGNRVTVIDREYSNFDKDIVIRQTNPGMELDGNVIRAAECIASLGREGEENGDESNE